MTATTDLGASNLVAVEPGAIREETPTGSVITSTGCWTGRTSCDWTQATPKRSWPTSPNGV